MERPPLSERLRLFSARWPPWSAHVWLVPILAFAVWLRFWGIQGEHLYGDEAEYAIVARYLARDFTDLTYPMLEGFGHQPFVSQPPLVLYMMAIAMRILGPTDFAAILVPALLGVATVVAVYALGHRLGGRLMAVSGSALVAVMPFHVEYSRQAMLDSGVAFFFVLTAYFLVAWVQDRTRRAALGVGIAGACACLSKLPGVLVVPAIALVFLAVVIAVLVRGRGEETPEWKETVVQGAIGAAPFAVGAGLYLGLLRMNDGLDALWTKLHWQLGRVDSSIAGVSSSGAKEWTWYFTDPSSGFKPLLGGLVFALAIVGLCAALLRFAQRPLTGMEHAVVPILVGVMLAFFLHSERKEGFYLLPFAPFAALLVGQAGDGLARMLKWANIKLSPGAAPRLAPLAIVAGLVLVAVPAYSAGADSVKETKESTYGYGFEEAAALIAERDPGAGQFGTLLGRFTLYWYNEHDTYHRFVNRSVLDQEVMEGRLKYVVKDAYIHSQKDKDSVAYLVETHNGVEIAKFQKGWGKVTVYELRPGPALPPTDPVMPGTMSEPEPQPGSQPDPASQEGEAPAEDHGESQP